MDDLLVARLIRAIRPHAARFARRFSRPREQIEEDDLFDRVLMLMLATFVRHPDRYVAVTDDDLANIACTFTLNEARNLRGILVCANRRNGNTTNDGSLDGETPDATNEWLRREYLSDTVAKILRWLECHRPSQEVLLFKLRREGAPAAEIAARLKTTPEHVYVLIHRQNRLIHERFARAV